MENNPINYSDPSGHYAICFQQGQASIDEATALSQICQELADSGAFGESGIYEDFESTENGAIEALEWLAMMLGEGGELMGREIYDIKDVVIPENVDSAYNIYATENAYGAISPFDQGEQNIEGALNVARTSTNHCTIAYESCGGVIPQQESSDSPINTTTQSYVKIWLDLLPFSGEW